MPNFFSWPFIQKTLAGFGLWCCLFLIPNAVQSAPNNSATLQWAANSESDLAGYKVYQGTTTGSYGPSIDVKNVTTYTVSNLQADMTYSFAITAYDLSGNESYPSDEVSKYIADSSLDLTPPSLSLTSPTNGTTISSLVTKQEIIDLAQDLKQTVPPAEPRTYSSAINLAQQPFTDTGNAVIIQHRETSPTNGTTISSLVTKQEIIDLAQDLKQTVPPAEPRTYSSAINLAQQPFTDTGNAVIIQPRGIIISH